METFSKVANGKQREGGGWEAIGCFRVACASPGGRGWERIWYRISKRRASQVALLLKNPPASARDTGAKGPIPGSGRVPGGGHGSPLQDSCLENPMDRGAWGAAVLGVAESQT